jgi:ADP-ribose pyrophosphatase YjhB (NUDIX family)
MADPDWLVWTRELQAMAQTGLTFTENPYDRDRYERLRALASDMMEAGSGLPAARLAGLFGAETGYATPKVDVRGAAFDTQGRILMVREVADEGRWTLPGGWADVNYTAAESVAKEMREESGFEVRVTKLAAAWDRTRQGHLPALFSCVKLFYMCEIIGGAAATSSETSEVAFFGEAELPDFLSTGRTMKHQLHRMFAHAREPGLATEFE